MADHVGAVDPGPWLLVGDVGGTKTSLSFCRLASVPVRLFGVRSYRNRDYADLGAVVEDFLQANDRDVRQACLAVAGPVSGSHVRVTNLSWEIDGARISGHFGLDCVVLINDVEALARAVPHLSALDVLALHPGERDPCAPIAVLAPGTGLGEAFLTWEGDRHAAHASEGGHADFAPTGELQSDLLAFLQREFGHVSIERVASGSGIPCIYRFLRDRLHLEEPLALTEQLARTDDPTPVIVSAALESTSALCVEALRTFASILGAEAGNLALKLLATGGIYIGGGLALRALPFLREDGFLAAVHAKGRFEPLLKRIPIRVILSPHATLLGAAHRGLEKIGCHASNARSAVRDRVCAHDGPARFVVSSTTDRGHRERARGGARMIRTVNPPERYDVLVASLDGHDVVPRIWAHDYTVWKAAPTEITDRLGWLHVPFSAMRELDRLRAFAESVRSDGLQHVVLLGMGGSSLAAQTISLALGTAPGFLDLTVLDSTHPDAVLAVEERLDLSRTLFLVATKSGKTPETLALFRHFFRRVRENAAGAEPGARFVAITDPGSPLAALASEHRFRETFLSGADVGGRYSALTVFGLVPAALLGVDLARLLGHAQRMAVACAEPGTAGENPAARLGAILGAAATDGRDKATLFFSPELEPFGSWLEQLIAESTGKEGTGILPVVGETVGGPSAYGSDRVFVRLSLGGGDEEVDELSPLERTGSPVVRIRLDDAYALGGQFFLWELAIAVVGHALKVNPFDQPNVEAAKARTRDATEKLRRTGPAAARAVRLDTDALVATLSDLRPGDYVALQAFLPPADDLTEAFSSLQAALRDRFRVATTFGYGPRFLHSTGQLHKGGRSNGRFVQLVSDPEHDIRIPDEEAGHGPSLSFGELIAAQAAGDRQALIDVGRPVSTFVVPTKPSTEIRRIASELGRAAPATRRRSAS